MRLAISARYYVAKWGERKPVPGCLIGAKALAAITEGPAMNVQGNRMMIHQLKQESLRKSNFCSEIGAELERMSAPLTSAQRNYAAKVLKQWERGGQERSYYQERAAIPLYSFENIPGAA